MIQLSIIVPNTGDQSAFDDTLLSVLENRPQHAEIIVPCRADYVDPYELGDEIAFRHCDQQASIVELLNCGIEACSGQVVFWIQPGIEVGSAWSEEALQPLCHDQDVAAVSPLVIDRQDPRGRQIVSAGVRYLNSGERKMVRNGRRRNTKFQVAGPTLSVGFCRRDVLMATGGFSQWVGDGLADVDLAAILDSANLKCEVIPACRVTGSAEKKRVYGFRASRRRERLYRRQAVRSDHRPSRMKHVVRAAWFSMSGLTPWSMAASWCGRLIGMWDSVRHTESIQETCRQLARINHDDSSNDEHRRAA